MGQVLALHLFLPWQTLQSSRGGTKPKYPDKLIITNFVDCYEGKTNWRSEGQKKQGMVGHSA